MEQLYSVYVLRSIAIGTLYVGMTTDVENRLSEHNRGKSKFTKGHMPWELIYQEFVGEAPLARKKEKYLKSTAGKNHLRKIGVIQD